ncbi:copper resistance protein CopC [Couchioplanes caeruleus]|uniref:copper resistance protein CopC n=1 Tax=Couchioplanes caeruleus TaxID=56438 RepID=UPI0020BE1FFA|nr:copper resistance protein CopC [Couchioplanes caeruleus]UQU67741.1 copper resistance protein CopC [Couchioplanes caeruleus]
MRTWLAAGAAAALLALLPSPARAGGPSVVGTDPPDGAALAAAPARVRVIGSAAPDPARSHLTVRDPRGRTVGPDTTPEAAGYELSRPVRLTGTGVFTMVFHVAFTDGRDAAGEIRFSVGTGVAPPAVRRAAAAAAGHDHGPDPLSAGLLLLDGAVVAVVALRLALGRRGMPSARVGPAQHLSSPDGRSRRR